MAAASASDIYQAPVGAVAMAAGVQKPSTTAQIQSTVTGSVFMPWPTHKPSIHVPFFDYETCKRVNLDVAPSKEPCGIDLPLNDITTLRFFFNLGVQQSRVVLTSKHLKNMHNTAQRLQQSLPMAPAATPFGAAATPANQLQQLQTIITLLQQSQQYRTQPSIGSSHVLQDYLAADTNDRAEHALNNMRSSSISTVRQPTVTAAAASRPSAETLLLQQALLASANGAHKLTDLQIIASSTPRQQDQHPPHPQTVFQHCRALTVLPHPASSHPLDPTPTPLELVLRIHQAAQRQQQQLMHPDSQQTGFLPFANGDASAFSTIRAPPDETASCSAFSTGSEVLSTDQQASTHNQASRPNSSSSSSSSSSSFLDHGRSALTDASFVANKRNIPCGQLSGVVAGKSTATADPDNSRSAAGHSSPWPASGTDTEMDDEYESPALGPMLMVSYLNACLGKASPYQQSASSANTKTIPTSSRSSPTPPKRLTSDFSLSPIEKWRRIKDDDSSLRTLI